MDGKGRWMDNRFVERLWRSLKYEAVYLEEILGGHHARRLIGSWVDHYNHRRPHLAFGGRSPPRCTSATAPACCWRRAGEVKPVHRAVRGRMTAARLAQSGYALLPQARVQRCPLHPRWTGTRTVATRSGPSGPLTKGQSAPRIPSREGIKTNRELS